MYQKGTTLSGKTAIITGAASGIGEAVSKIFAANQCKVLLVDINGKELERVSREIEEDGGTCRSVCADITDEDRVISFFHETVETWGTLDILINSAGRDSLSPPVSEVTLEEWNKTIGPNLTAVFLCTREAFRIMERQPKGGRIISMGSTSAKTASSPGHSPYRASKHGMMGFCKNVFLEGKDKSIGVTVINPSHVKTPMLEIIDRGLYAENLPAYVDGWLDEKEKTEGLYASSIEVEHVAEITLLVAAKPAHIVIPEITIYPSHKIDRYGMDV